MSTRHQFWALIFAASQLLLPVLRGLDPLATFGVQLSQATVTPNSYGNSENFENLKLKIFYQMAARSKARVLTNYSFNKCSPYGRCRDLVDRKFINSGEKCLEFMLRKGNLALV